MRSLPWNTLGCRSTRNRAYLPRPVSPIAQFTAALLSIAGSAWAAESNWVASTSGMWSDPTRWTAGVPSSVVDARFGLRPSQRAFDVTLSGLSFADSLIVANERPRLLGTGAGQVLLIDALDVGSDSPDHPPPSLQLEHVALVASTIAVVGGSAGGGELWCGDGGALLVPRIDVGGPISSGVRVADGGSVTLAAVPGTRSLHVGVGTIGEILVEAGGVLDSTAALDCTVGSAGGEGSLQIAAGGTLRMFRLNVGDGANESRPSGHGELHLNGGRIEMTEGGVLGIGTEGSPAPAPLATLNLHSGSVVNGAIVFGLNSAPLVAPDGARLDIERLSLVSTRFGPAVIEHGATWVGDWIAIGFGAAAELVTAPGSTLSLHSAYLGIGGYQPVDDAGVGTLTVGGSVQIAGDFLSPFLSWTDTVGQLDLESTGSFSAKTAVIGPWGEARWTLKPGAALAFGSCALGDTGRVSIDIAHDALCTIEHSLIVDAAPEGYAPDARSATVTIGAGGHFAVGELRLGTSSRLDVSLGAEQLETLTSAGDAAVSAGALSLGGTLRIGFAPDVEPALGSVFAIASATEIHLEPTAVERAEGAPLMQLSVANGRLLATVVPTPDSLTVLGPSYVEIGVPFQLDAIAVGANGEWDATTTATWTVVDGAIVHLGGSSFVATSSGSATVEASLAGVTNSWTILGAAPILPELVLVNGSPGLWANPILPAPALSPFYSETLSTQAISDDGVWVVFASKATNLAPGEVGSDVDIFVKNVLDGTLQRVSTGFVGPDQGPSDQDGGGVNAAISGDGRFIAYAAQLPNGAGSPDASVVVRDRWTGAVEYVAMASDGTVVSSSRPQISRDGRFVAFASAASTLVAGDTNGKTDVFVRDRMLGTTIRVSGKPDGSQATSSCTLRGLSADGHFVLFSTQIANLETLFRFDRDRGLVELAAPADDGGYPTVDVASATISADGNVVVFAAPAYGGFVPEPAVTAVNVFLHRFSDGQTTPVSMRPDGTWADGVSLAGRVSANGRYVHFVSTATNLVPGTVGASNGHVYRRDMLTGSIERMTELGGVQFAGKLATDIAVNADGSVFAFQSSDPNIFSGDVAASMDVFLRSVPRPVQGDVNGDGLVEAMDLAMVMGDWGGSRFDLDGDGVVGAADIAVLLANWT